MMLAPSHGVNPRSAGLVRYQVQEVNTVQAAMETNLERPVAFATTHRGKTKHSDITEKKKAGKYSKSVQIGGYANY